MRGEGRVCIVAARIQHGNDRSLTGIVNATAVENTRGIHINRVFYCRHRLKGLGNGDSGDTVDLADRIQILVGGGDEGTVKNVRVGVLHLSRKPLA